MHCTGWLNDLTLPEHAQTQIRPLADNVHSKYSFTYLLTYLLSTT